MPVRALIVDDSSFFRRRISEVLNADPGIEVVGIAVDGRDALRKVAELKPDVITMDIEMPVMNGIEATRQITRAQGIPILMFSSLTHEGAQATLDALDAGALDFLPKRFDEISNNTDQARQVLCTRVKTIARGRRPLHRPAGRPLGNKPSTPSSRPADTAPAPSPNKIQVVRSDQSSKRELISLPTTSM